MVKVIEVVYKVHDDLIGTMIPVEEKEIGTFQNESEALDAIGADKYFFFYSSYMGGWERIVDYDSGRHSVYRIEELV